MSGALLFIWLLALGLGVLAHRRGDGSHLEGLTYGADQLVRVLPRIVMALLASGFIAKLIPSAIVGTWIGSDSGARGILVAACAGLLVPAGPVVAFSLGAILAQAGAAPPQLVAFITSWCIFAIHRVTIFELPMLGWRFLALRLTASALLPVVAGILAGGLHLVVG